jgi:hypothetical protein
MTRHVVVHGGDLSGTDPGRGRGLERVDRLIRIECPKLIADHGLVIGDHRQASDLVIDDVGCPAEMRVPREAVVIDGESDARELEIGAREKSQRVARRVQRLRSRLLRSSACGPCQHDDHEARCEAPPNQHSDGQAFVELLLEVGDALLQIRDAFLERGNLQPTASTIPGWGWTDETRHECLGLEQ